MKNIPLTIFSAFFSVVSGIVVIFYAEAFVNVVKANSWVETKCLVQKASIKFQRGNGKIIISYEYQTPTGTYTGDQYKFLNFGFSSGIRELPDNIKVGGATTCFYDPDNHAISVINKGLTWDFIFGIIAFLVFAISTLIVIGSVFDLIKKRKR